MFRGEKIVFTGKLDTLSRKQAQDLVSALGGKPQAAVTKDTTILVIGKATISLFQEDSRSLKMQKVEALQEEGRLSGLNEALNILQLQLLKYKADQQ